MTATRCSNASFVSGPGQMGPTLTTPATVCRTAISQQTIPAIDAPIIMVRSSDLPRLSRRVMQSVVISCRSWGLPWYGDCPKPTTRGRQLLAVGRIPGSCAELSSIVGRGERQTWYINGEAREASLDQARDDGRPERVRASQAVDEVEGQAGAACRLPRVEDGLAVDLCERHLGCVYGRREDGGMDRVLLWYWFRYGVPGTEMQDRGLIWRKLTGHATQHDGGVTDQKQQPTTVNKIENTKINIQDHKLLGHARLGLSPSTGPLLL